MTRSRTRGGSPLGPRRGVLVAVTVAVAVVAAACGISPEDEAVVHQSDAVPFGLLESPTTTSTSTTEPSATATTTRPPDTVVGAVYLWHDDRLVPVDRDLPRQASLAQLINALAAGPTAGEADSGLSTGISDVATIRGVSMARGTATVDLDRTFVEAGPMAQSAALIQVIFTLTAWPGVGRVAFTLEGGPVEVPRGDGTLTTEPLARDDFPDLVTADPP